MIRIRKNRHEVQPVNDADAVEIVHEGRLAMVIIHERGGSVRVMTPGDPLFNAYCRANRLTPSNVTVHEPFDGQAMPTGG